MDRVGKVPANTIGWLAAGIALSIGVLSWFGYHAIQEWRQSAILLAERRSNEAANLLIEALTRDMRGVQESILGSSQWEHFASDRPYEMSTLVASAFARYPYPETIFAWNADVPADGVWFFNRASRRPEWMTGAVGPSRFPVIIEQDPTVARLLVDQLRDDAVHGRRVSVFDVTIQSRQYQVVSQLTYRDPFRDQLQSVVGFTVNLAWAETHYVVDLARQVWEIGGGTEKGLTLSVRDGLGRQVAGSPIDPSQPLTNRRGFSLAFFDLDSALEPGQRVEKSEWTVAVSAQNDPTLSQAIQGANRTMMIGVVSAVMLGIGLVLTARAERSHSRLVDLRADFVSTVTHELKAPIATIRAAAETLARGRLSGRKAFQDYGEIVVIEAKRLTRLVENLLAYSRITDVADVYVFQSLDVRALLEDVRAEFEIQLNEAGFEVELCVPADMPPVRGDRTALTLLLDNLIDNAIRYSPSTRHLSLTAGREAPGYAVLNVADVGIGIPADEIASITRKFVRGRRTQSSGNGLGLAIAARIAHDHGGFLKIRSVEAQGTTVSVSLPIG